MSLVTGDSALHFATHLDNSGLQRGVNSAQGILRGFAQNIGKMDIYGGLTFAAVYALRELATTAFQTSKEFESSMHEIQTISVATKNDFIGMSEAIVSVGLDVPQTSDQLAKAFYQIASAGFDGAAGIELLNTSARASVGGITDVQTSADGITTALGAWNLSAEYADSVADKFFKTIKLGKTTFPELANGLSTVANIAAASGVSLDGVLAAVASLTQKGVPTAQAFTQIRSAIVATNEVLGDGWGKTLSLQEAFGKLTEKAGGSQSKLRELVGRVEAVNAVLGLTGTNSLTAASHLEELTNSTGAAAEAFDIMITTAENQSKLLAANVENAMRPLGDFLIATYTDITTFFNEAFKTGDLEKFAKIVAVASAGLITYKTASAVATLSQMDLLRAVVRARKAFAALNLATKANIYVLLATAVVSAASAFVLFTNNVEKAETAQEKLNKVKTESLKNIQEEKSKITQLVKIAGDVNRSTRDRARAIFALNKINKEYLGTITLENIATTEATEAVESYIKILEKKTFAQLAQKKLYEYDEKIYNLRIKQIAAEKKAAERIETDKLPTSYKGGNIAVGIQIGQNIEAKRVETIKNDIVNLRAAKNEYLAVLSELKVSILDTLDDNSDTGTGDTNQPALTYYAKLKLELENARKGLLALSNDTKSIDLAAVAAQNKIIQNIEKQIKEQEQLLGITQATTEEYVVQEQAVQQITDIAEDKVKSAGVQTGHAAQLSKYTFKELKTLKKTLLLRTKIKDTVDSTVKGTAEELENVEKEINKRLAGSLQNVSGFINSISDSLHGLSPQIAEFLNTIGSAIQDVSNIMLSVGRGDWLGAIAGGFHLLTSIFSGDSAREAVQETISNLISEQNRKLQKQLNIVAKLRGTDIYEGIADAGAEIDKQLATIEKGIAQLQSRDMSIFRDMFGLDFNEEITELEDRYQELLDTQNDIYAQLYETVTGTTSDSITDSILQGFADGKLAAEDFAADFESLMKQSLMETFKIQFLQKQFDNFYSAFGEAAESDGMLTVSEIETLRTMFTQNIEQAREGWDAMQNVFSDVFDSAAGADSGQGISGELRASLTEATGTVLSGTLNHIRVLIDNHTQIYAEMRDSLQIISSNSLYLQRLENIEQLLTEQNDNLRGVGLQ